MELLEVQTKWIHMPSPHCPHHLIAKLPFPLTDLKALCLTLYSSHLVILPLLKMHFFHLFKPRLMNRQTLETAEERQPLLSYFNKHITNEPHFEHKALMYE